MQGDKTAPPGALLQYPSPGHSAEGPPIVFPCVTPPFVETPPYCKRGHDCFIHSPDGHLCNFIPPSLRKIIPPRAKYVILLGHAQDIENCILHKLIRIRDRSAKEYVIYLIWIPPQIFRCVSSFFCVDSNFTLSGFRENKALLLAIEVVFLTKRSCI